MPSPIGHVLAGVALSQCSRKSARKPSLILLCATLAALPDADLVPSAFGFNVHRTVTHGIGAAAIVMIIAAGVTGWVTGRIDWKLSGVCGAAWASHVLLDWLGYDPNPPFGIWALWPFSHDWYVSGLRVFLPTERRELFTEAFFATNTTALIRELLVMVPVVAMARWVRLRVNVKSAP
jgi:inner membrane protein